MRQHRVAGGSAVAILYRRQNGVMLGKAVVIDRGHVELAAQPPPHHRPPHRVQLVEHRQQRRVLGALGDGVVKAVVERFIRAPRRRPAQTRRDAVQRLDLLAIAVQRGLMGQCRFQCLAGLDDLLRRDAFRFFFAFLFAEGLAWLERKLEYYAANRA